MKTTLSPDEVIEKLREFRIKVQNDKELGKKVLFNAGIIDSSGNLTDEYK